MQFNWPGETVVNRLIQTLENSVGGVLRPWQIRREGQAAAEAKAKEMLLLAKAEMDIADLRAGRKQLDGNGRLVDAEPTPLLLGDSTSEQALSTGDDTIQTLRALARSTEEVERLQRAVNLKRTATFAEEEAERIDTNRPQEKAESDVRVDEDWLSRWRTGAQDVRKEEMQRLWGRLLAREVAAPGSYSLHSVAFLSRMSAADAEVFASVAPFVTEGGIIRDALDDKDKETVSIRNLLYLDDLGLVHGASGITALTYNLTAVEMDGQKYATMSAHRVGLVFDLPPETPPGEKSPIKFSVYPVTQVGREILTLAEFSPNEAYLRRIAEFGVRNGATRVRRGEVTSTHYVNVTDFVSGPLQ